MLQRLFIVQFVVVFIGRYIQRGVVAFPPLRIGEYRIGNIDFSDASLCFGLRMRLARKQIRMKFLHECTVNLLDLLGRCVCWYAKRVIMG